MLTLSTSRATAVIDPELGGRITSLTIDGTEVLVTGTSADNAMAWGCYPMVPWAGRVRRGRFRFDGLGHHLPVNLEPHAIHGTGFTARWQLLPDDSMLHRFPADWPFGGHALQRFEIDETGLMCRMEVHADRHPMPAMAGWHPWFRRPVSLSFSAEQMYQRDDDGIPDGALVSPPPPPWDDCFVGVRVPPQLSWPDGPTVTVTSNCDHWVVYDEPAHAICVEPQSGPPDEFNLRRHVVQPGTPLTTWMRLSWA